MSDQLTLEDAVTARDKAIEQVERNAYEHWLDVAYEAIRTIAQTEGTFTADEVWRLIDWTGATTHEPRAMGAVMKRAVKDGLIEPTGQYRKSTRPQCHARPQPVYASRIRSAA